MSEQQSLMNAESDKGTGSLSTIGYGRTSAKDPFSPDRYSKEPFSFLKERWLSPEC